MDKYPMTPAGLAALNQELAELKASRLKVSQEIETAREHGDLKENAEYHAAKEKQGLMEARVRDLEGKIAAAEVIDPTTLSGDRVKFGATVTLEDIDTGNIVTYQIVGSEEADIEGGTISITSPMARALINREIGDEVRVKAPKGIRIYEIQDVVFQ